MHSDRARSFDEYVLRAKKDINSQLEQFIATTPPDMQPLYRHALMGKSKRFRPLLICAASDMFGLSWSTTALFRQAIEIIHTASLIFDDLPAQDNAELRRGKQALHKAFPEGKAQVAGLAMLFDANKLIAQQDSAQQLNGVLTQYVNTRLGSSGLCLGQMKDLDIFGIELNQVTEKFLDEITDLKTSSLLKICLGGTALIAQQPQPVVKTLEAFALHLGIVFQIQDDLLDSNSEKITGKSAHVDDKNKKPNYIHVLGLQKARTKQTKHRQEAEKALQKLTPQFDTSQLRSVLDLLV